MSPDLQTVHPRGNRGEGKQNSPSGEPLMQSLLPWSVTAPELQNDLDPRPDCTLSPWEGAARPASWGAFRPLGIMSRYNSLLPITGGCDLRTLILDVSIPPSTHPSLQPHCVDAPLHPSYTLGQLCGEDSSRTAPSPPGMSPHQGL